MVNVIDLLAGARENSILLCKIPLFMGLMRAENCAELCVSVRHFHSAIHFGWGALTLNCLNEDTT